MRFTPFSKYVLPPRAILLALALAFAWEPATARAGCGNHVRFSGDKHSVDPASRSLPMPAPCTGPSCSRNEGDTPLTTIEPSTTDDWGCLAAPLTPPPADTGILFDAIDRPGLPALPSSIFHPPRD
jgi:hypothetical protein